MKVKFLLPFGGRETKEIHFEAGDHAELESGIALDLIARGITESAEPVAEIEPAQVVIEQPKKKAGKK